MRKRERRLHVRRPCASAVLLRQVDSGLKMKALRPVVVALKVLQLGLRWAAVVVRIGR
jgi:hypothetical protein